MRFKTLAAANCSKLLSEYAFRLQAWGAFAISLPRFEETFEQVSLRLYSVTLQVNGINTVMVSIR